MPKRITTKRKGGIQPSTPGSGHPDPGGSAESRQLHDSFTSVTLPHLDVTAEEEEAFRNIPEYIPPKP